MKLFKNREIRITVLVFAALGLAAAFMCLLFDWRASIVCVCLTAAIVAAYLISAKRRYENMAALSEGIDRMLSGVENVDLTAYTEGELSILKNELTKLTVQLHGQAGELKKDKQLLADYIADISHQIRTPLTAINLILAALGEPEVSIEKRSALHSDLYRQLSRIDWLVNALLKLARLDAGAVSMNVRSVSLEELIANSVEPVAIQMELREQTAETEASGSVACDPSWTAEALTNIIKNCSEHMGAGTLHIKASENPLYSEIVIRDEGEGISADDLPHLFERFYKGKNSKESSVGIGLALCRMIIVKQNGAVKAENDVQGGAKFTVRLYKSAV